MIRYHHFSRMYKVTLHPKSKNPQENSEITPQDLAFLSKNDNILKNGVNVDDFKLKKLF